MSYRTNDATAYYDNLMQRFCKNDTQINQYIANLTSSYADKSNEASMVAASVLMFLLAGLFFNLNLFSRFSDVSAILDPKVRVFLSSALSLFLPVMSYLFSEAKNTGYVDSAKAGAVGKPDLSLRAGVILVWMLLVELLRKKVDEIHMRGYSSTVQRAGRVAWLGSLVFFNIRSTGRKAFFCILWILCATKVVQRIAFTEVGKRSYAYGKNARLVTSYMSQLKPRRREHQRAGIDRDTRIAIEDTAAGIHLQGGGGGHGDSLPLMKSELIVMGEEDLIVEATADGYELKDVSAVGTVVTVGRIWHQLSAAIDPDQRLKRLCLSFSLFKLLRRRFEHLPATPAETQECRDLIFRGVYDGSEGTVDAVFHMMTTEVSFLSEYYHSVIPVVFASPFFFLVNYFLLPVVVLSLCLMAAILCGNGDGRYTFHSIRTDNFAISSGVAGTTACLFLKAVKSPPAFFTVLDFSVTFLLFVIFFYEEVWEFIVFLLSNWFMVSLLCSYVARPRWQGSPTLSAAVRRIVWVRSRMSQPALSFKQFSALNTRWPPALAMPSMLSLPLRTEPVPNKAKHSIMRRLCRDDGGPAAPLSNGKSVVAGDQNEFFQACEREADVRDKLLRACGSESIAEVILTWHIATSIFEEECHSPSSSSDVDDSRVATRLSKYCAYLVAFHPELLPDNQDKTEKVFEAMKAELKKKLTCCKYYFSCWSTRVAMIRNEDIAATTADDDKGVVNRGARLGALLIENSRNDRVKAAWKLLADVWTELIVYVAPSSDEERVIGHEKVLVEGGEFITALWVLTTHAGITRPAKNPAAAAE